MKARSVFSGKGFRIIVAVSVLLFFSLQMVTAQEWYNPAWPYRAPLTIENSLTGPLTDFQVQVNLNASGPWSSAASDGSDLRFTASDGVTELPYWIETWVYGDTACIWVKVPAIAASNGDPMNPEATVFMYYGASSMPVPEPVATPPAGPFTKHAGNPGVINGVGAPGATENILPENIVYDPVTQHYWMVLSDQTGGPYVGLVYSDDPANPDAWYWSGYPITGNPLAIAPHLIEYNGTWYIFYGDRSVASPYPISVASSSSVSGPYTKVGEVLPAGATGTWEDARVDEPYVFQRSDGTWILMYMGDAGSNVEQVGYATASSITGPYTKYTGNPCIPFGAAGSFDAGTVADPWVYEFDGVYYIGYTVSPSTSSPWQTALATTTDWVTFTKHGIILPRGTEYNSFRGAVTRIGDQYVFPYTGGPDNGQYRLCIATQPVFAAPPSSGDGDATFDFFDDFDGTILDVSKWIRTNGSSPQFSFDGDIMRMTGVPGTYAKIDAIKEFDFGYIGETYGQHDNDIPFVANEIIEYGFMHGSTYDLRITDNYPTLNRYQRYIGDTYANFGPAADNEWHLFGLYRRSPGTAGFRVDDSEVTYSSSISTALLHPFLMAYAGSSTSGLPGQNFNVDWTRVRKYAEVDPVVTVGTVEDNINQWIGETSIYWNEPANWSKGVPDSSMNVFIAAGTTYQPFIETESACRTIVINPGTTLTIGGTTTLNVAGDWINNGTFSTSATATVNFNGETQAIGGTGYNAFQNVTINSSVSATLTATVELYGNLSILSGVFDIGEYTINNTQPAGVLSVADNATLKIGDVNTLPGGYDSHILGPGSFTEYYGLDQQVAATTYGNLILSGNGTKTILSSITVTGNIKITESAMASLADGTVSTAGSLILGTEGQAEGTWGSSSVSPAPDHTNDTYFTSTGILDVNVSITAGYWLGVTNNDWNTVSNWQGGAIPLPATDVVIPVYAVHAPVITGMSLPAVCNNLTVNQGAILTIEPGQALTVNGDLVNEGNIEIETSWVNSNGSLIVSGSPSGTGIVSYRRFLREGDDTGDKHLLASPVSGQDVTDFISAFGTKIDSVRIWNEYAGAWQRIESGMFTSGQGYNICQSDDSDGEFVFTGSMENTAVFTATSPYADPYLSRPAADRYGNTDPTQITWTTDRGYISEAWANWGGGGWNLLGNPFTSAMNADQFITVNASDFDPYYQALYVYDGKNGYYRYVATVVPGYDQQGDPEFIQGGTFGNRIQAGQGFLVMANNNEVEFDFSPDMQVHQTALPLLKSSTAEEPWPGLKLKVKWGEKENLTTIVFNDVMKNSLDPGYDVGLLSTGPEVEIYTALVEKDEAINLTRQALPVAGADTLKIPVGIDCYAGAEITFSAYTIPMGNRRFWLEDRTAGTFTDLSQKGYTVTLPENTFGTGRFFIIASTNTPTSIRPPTVDNGTLRIWVAHDKIVLKGNTSQDARCELFDVNGKRILERQLADGELNTIDIPAGLHGIYLVRVIDRHVITTRKIVIL